MALFNETLQGRFNEVIRRLHAMKGTPAPQVSPEIGHDIVLESDRPEFHVLHGGGIWVARGTAGANVGFFSAVGIRNPVASGLLVVVQHAAPANLLAAAHSYQIRIRPIATIQSQSTSFVADSRKFAFGGNCPVIVTTDNANFATQAAVGNGPVEVIGVQAGDNGLLNSPPYVISPGFEILVVGDAANQALDCSFSGYFRPLTPEEVNIL